MLDHSDLPFWEYAGLSTVEHDVEAGMLHHPRGDLDLVTLDDLAGATQVPQCAVKLIGVHCVSGGGGSVGSGSVGSGSVGSVSSVGSRPSRKRRLVRGHRDRCMPRRATVAHSGHVTGGVDERGRAMCE